jgi:hypothetical protein
VKIVSIHQPNFFPWLGYFDKIARADIFVFLDHVQFPKKGGTWINRVKTIISGDAKWFTATIDRQYHGTRRINEMNFLRGNPWREKLLKSLEHEYNKHPFFSEVVRVIRPLMLNPENRIAEYNIQTITELAKAVGLNTEKMKRSSQYSVNGASNEMLCALTRAVGGEVYLCGGGAESYQEDEKFATQGIGLQYQNFVQPMYPQKSQASFVPGLSIIDILMNQGFEWVKSWLNKDLDIQNSNFLAEKANK